MFRQAFPEVSDSEFSTLRGWIEFNGSLIMDYQLQRAANGNDVIYSCAITKGFYNSVQVATDQGMEAMRSALKKSIG